MEVEECVSVRVCVSVCKHVTVSLLCVHLSLSFCECVCHRSALHTVWVMHWSTVQLDGWFLLCLGIWKVEYKEGTSRKLLGGVCRGRGDLKTSKQPAVTYLKHWTSVRFKLQSEKGGYAAGYLATPQKFNRVLHHLKDRTSIRILLYGTLWGWLGWTGLRKPDWWNCLGSL